jgi:hypothetical protein
MIQGKETSKKTMEEYMKNTLTFIWMLKESIGYDVKDTKDTIENMYTLTLKNI